MFRRLPVLLAAAFLLAPLSAEAQVRDPTDGELDSSGYVPPGEIVSFGPDTPFSQFVQSVGPLFRRATGKTLIDPTGRIDPIGFYVTGLPYRDALNLVLARAGLALRETDRYFIIEEAGLGAVGGPPGAVPLAVGGADRPTAGDREIRIDAVIFELNLNRVREIGTNWGAVFGENQGQTGGGQGGQAQDRLRLFLRTESFFDAIAAVIDGPNRIDLAELNRLFRLLESNGVGRTVSTPSIVVRSGQEGRVQSGSDIPVTLRDFAGNTVQQFISTGIIIEARPELIVSQDEVGNAIEFIHLLVDVERSTGRLTGAGVTVDKNQGTTDLLFVDGEQQVLGGLYSTEQTVSRTGIPILKDIPLIGFFFGNRTTSYVERELIIVLQASLLDPLRVRAARPAPSDLIDRERTRRGVRLDRTQSGFGESSERLRDQ